MSLRLASDEEFLRRVHLDLIELQPMPDEIRAFVASADPQKREKSRFSVPHPAQRNVVPWASRPRGYQVSLSYVSSTSPLDFSTLAVARMIR